MITAQRREYKFTIRMIAASIRVTATIVILILAAIGLLALIYPVPRSDILILINELQDQFFMLTGG